MTQSRKTLITLALAATALLIFFFAIRDTTTRYNWKETYDEDKNPYGTYVVHKLLETYVEGYELVDISTSINEVIPSVDSMFMMGPANYVLIGEGMFLDSMETDRLLAFVAHGNTALISTKTIPYNIITEVYDVPCFGYDWEGYRYFRDTLVFMNFQHKNLKTELGYPVKFLSHQEYRSYRWHWLEDYNFCGGDTSLVVLGSFNEDQYINFFSKDYGAGQFYFHSNPISFSNIILKDSSLLDYASGVFSHLIEGDIYWDNTNRVSLGIAEALDENNANNRISSKGPLTYILTQPPLTWAWYTACGMALLYLFFRSRRRQRIIPVIAKNKNTSLEFIKTVGQLYFQKGDHKKLCLKKMNLFLGFIRQRYHLTAKEPDNQFIEKLVAKSEIPKSIIDKIVLYYNNIKDAKFVSEKTLIDFHLEMDKFYKNCK